MRTANRHMRYRRSVYRKRRIKIILISSIIAIVVGFLLFIIIGNALNNKVENNISQRKEKASTTQIVEHSVVKSVYAHPVPLSDESSKLSTRLSRLKESGISDVCFELNSLQGTWLYSSAVAQSLGKQMAGVDLWSLGDVASLCDENGLYATGIIYLNDFNNDNDLNRTAALGYYSAQIAEALREGLDDVLIYVGDIPTEQRYDELIGLANDVHRLCPQGHIGLSLPPTVFANTDMSGTVDSLWANFDYLAVDLSTTPADTDAADYVDQQLGSMLYYLLRYNVRALLPYSDDNAQLDKVVSVVKSNGSQNIQIMPYKEN